MRRLVLLILVGVAAFVALVVWRPQTFPWAQAYVPAALKAVPADAGKAGGQAAPGSRSRGGGPVAIAVASVTTGDMPLIERTYGVVQSPAVVQVNARISSQVMQIHVIDGQEVKVGDLLITLDDRSIQAQYAKDQATLARDQATQISTAADLARAKSLADSKTGTKQAYDQALAANKVALANIEADKAAITADEVQLSFTRITAPIDGRLGQIAVAVGDLVSTSSTTSLMTITRTAPLKIETQLPERLLPQLREAGKDGVTVRAYRTSTDTLLDEGKVDFINSAVNTASGTISIAATVSNTAGKLWPGQHVDVEVQYGSLTKVTIVPTVAVQQGQKGSFVWLVKDGKSVEQRPVVVARDENGFSAISEGLEAADQVVVEGQLKLAPGSAVKISGEAAVAESGAASVKTP